MRKFFPLRPFLCALTLLCAAGCSDASTEPAPEPSREGLAMRFGIPDLESRAAFTAADLQQTGAAVRVWGTYHKSGPSAPVAAATVFDGTVVTRDDAGLWNYDETQYWFPGFTYHFRALFPADFAARSNAAAAIAAADRGDGMHLTVAGFDASKQLDLLAAAAGPIESRPAVAASKVAFRFLHLLAQVRFTAFADPDAGAAVTVTSVRLHGIPRIADWSGAGLDPATAARGSWSWNAVTTADDTFAADDSPKTLSVDAAAPTALLADRTLLIPQRLDGCRLTIAYRYAGETADRTASVSLAAVSGALSRWEAGKSYRYRITIGPADFILFEAPTIEPWQESTGGSIRID